MISITVDTSVTYSFVKTFIKSITVQNFVIVAELLLRHHDFSV